MSNRQISVRPSQELLAGIEAIAEEYQLSDAEVLRQLLTVGMKSYKAGECTIAPAKSGLYSRATGQKISKKIRGRVVRNVGAYYEQPAAANTPPVRSDIHE